MILETARLVLRDFIPQDREPFSRINSDPRVLEFLGPALDRATSDAWVDRIIASSLDDRPRLLAVTDRGVMIGYVGLSVPSFDAQFTPCVEIGWRLSSASWGYGFATEAAVAVLDWGFTHHGLDEIVSFTTVSNHRSRRVMEKIGMSHDSAGDFDHPRLEPGNPLRPHVLYRITSPRGQHSAPSWSESESARAT